MTPESAPERAEAVRLTQEPFEAADGRQKALFEFILLESGFELGAPLETDGETIRRLCSSMRSLGYAIRPLANRF